MASYDYDEKAASHADDVANRIDTGGPYIGVFKRAEATVSAQKGTEGITLEFEVPGGGSVENTLWTRKSDGSSIFGDNMVQAIRLILGVKGSMNSVPGKVMVWEEGKKVEADGEVFPQLCGKRIGVVFQKELFTKNNGQEGWRMNLYGVFDADSKLTASEIKEGVKEPKKLERLVRSAQKVKDSRVAAAAEPAQPAVGAAAGDY